MLISRNKMDSSGRRRRNQDFGVCDCLRPVVRVLGVATAIVLCGVGVDVLVHGHNGGILIIVVSFMILFLETMWCVTLFLQVCLRDDYHNLIGCWDKSSMLLGSWRLAPPYVAIGVALIVWPQGLWLSPVAGGFLIVLAACHLFEICRGTTRGRRDTLLPQTIPDADLERYDDMTEVLDDTLPSPVTVIPEDDDLHEI